MPKKTCPQCQTQSGPRTQVCPQCKYEFGVKSSKSSGSAPAAKGKTVAEPPRRREMGGYTLSTCAGPYPKINTINEDTVHRWMESLAEMKEPNRLLPSAYLHAVMHSVPPHVRVDEPAYEGATVNKVIDNPDYVEMMRLVRAILSERKGTRLPEPEDSADEPEPDGGGRNYGDNAGIVDEPEDSDDMPPLPSAAEHWSNEKKAEYLLNGAIDDDDYQYLRRIVKAKLGLDPDSVKHMKPE